MKIRQLTGRDDFAALGNLFLKSFKVAYSGMLSKTYLDNLTADQWTKRLKSNPQENWVLVDGDKYLGVSTINAARDQSMPGYGEIRAIYVDPTCFRQGYGSILLANDFKQLKQQGYTRVYLWALAENIRAKKFYEKYELCENGSKQVQIDDQTVRLIRFVKLM
ncbi:GNAT family N-acetyltransferase [Pediococcus ethanolidurans]|uniref:GNAT family N-acetyltransferase n=1 Tax=Pediococcus ethanolidurans TaxID=319653 RepID=UPI0029559803|nr:GNAT family N-acetyltransferase [Pediococcus ethanolidurans]MDV7720329.1 GNAT family N-acetyltransferase [Pediococcus ethanolidurans]